MPGSAIPDLLGAAARSDPHHTMAAGTDESICEHLTALLRTSQGSSRAAPDFGMPPFEHLGSDRTGACRRFEARVAAVIRRYEPRLRDVAVRCLPPQHGAEHGPVLRLEITARVVAAGNAHGVTLIAIVPDVGPVEILQEDRRVRERYDAIRAETEAALAALHPRHAELASTRLDRRDPHVERLVEAFAWLTARVEEQIVGDFPELGQTLLETLFPWAVRAVPAFTTVEFTQRPRCAERPLRIEPGTELRSRRRERTPLTFTTCFPVDVVPLRIDSVTPLAGPGDHGRLVVAISSTGRADLRTVLPERLRFHLADADGSPLALQRSLMHDAEAIRCEAFGRAADRPAGTLRMSPRDVVTIPGLTPCGDDGHDAPPLLPGNEAARPGVTTLFDYFSFPARYHYVDVRMPAPERRAWMGDASPITRLEITFELGRVPERFGRLTSASMRLFCTPVVNLFSMPADPIRLDRRRIEYPLHPADDECTVHAVQRVEMLGPTPRVLPDLHRLQNIDPREDCPLVAWESVVRSDPGAPRHTRAALRFLSGAGALRHPSEADCTTISVDLLCSNGEGVEALRPGDLCERTPRSPEFADFRDIGGLRGPTAMPQRDELHHTLLRLLHLNQRSVTDAATLRSLLSTLEHLTRGAGAPSDRDLRAAAIRDVRSRLAHGIRHGCVVPRLDVEVQVDPDRFDGPGDLHLFSSVLDAFVAAETCMGTLSRLTVDVAGGSSLAFPARAGDEALA